MPNGKEAEPGTPGQELLQLEFGQIFVRREGDLVLNPVRAKITLFESQGHIYNIKGKWAVSSAGYVHLNRIAGISIVTPQSIIIDGREQPNPHVERNPVTKAIDTCNVRKIGIGYSPLGNLVILDQSLFYNVYTYLLQSFQSKMKQYSRRQDRASEASPATAKAPPTTAPEPPAMLGMKTERPKEAGRWAWFEMAAPLGIWINYERQEIIDCLEEHVQRQRFGDRIAQKIVMRNILKDHPAIGLSQVEASGPERHAKATAWAYGWRHTATADDLKRIAAEAERGETMTGEQVSARIIEADVEEEEVAQKEVQEEAGVGDRDEQPLIKRKGVADGDASQRPGPGR